MPIAGERITLPRAGPAPIWCVGKHGDLRLQLQKADLYSRRHLCPRPPDTSYDLRFAENPLGLSPCWKDVNPGISRTYRWARGTEVNISRTLENVRLKAIKYLPAHTFSCARIIVPYGKPCGFLLCKIFPSLARRALSPQGGRALFYACFV